MSSSILLVDEDKALADSLQQQLESEGFEVHCIHDGATAIKKIGQKNFDGIILDMKLPQDGFEVLQTIRKHWETPVLMLTSAGDDISKMVELDLGADDYLPKPCNPRELVSRLRAILRRNQKTSPQQDVIIHHGLQLNPAQRQVSHHGQTLELSTAEFNILEILLKSPGQAFSKEELTECALGRKYTVYDQSIDAHISNLRTKLSDNHDSEAFIRTVRGFGYLFVA